VVYQGERRVAAGTEQSRESIADQMIEAKAGMSTQLEAFSANTIEFLRRERTLILDGVGVPDVRVSLRDRHVVVVAPGKGNAEDLALLIADRHQASLVVTVGFQATLREFLDRGRSGSNPSTFLTRLKLGTKLVDGKAVATLHRNRVSLGALVLLVLATIVVV